MEDESIYRARLDQLERSSERLSLENSLLETIITREGLSISSEPLDDVDPLSVGKLGSLCRREIKHLEDNIVKAKEEADTAEESLRLQLDIIERRILHLQKESFNFKRDVMIGAQNQSTLKPVAEQVLQYFETKSIEVDVTIKEILTHCEDIKCKLLRAEAKLKRKASNDVQYIDFHQLQIESQKLTRKANATKEVLEATRFACRIATNDLAGLKKELRKVQEGVDVLEKQIAKTQEMLVNCKVDLVKATSDRELIGMEVKPQKAITFPDSSKRDERFEPMKLIKQQVQIQDLKRLVKNLERKLEIVKGVRHLKTTY